MLHTKKLTVLGLTLFVLATALACAQILGDVEVCQDQPDRPCSGTPPDQGVGNVEPPPGPIVVPQLTEPCINLDELRCNGPEFQRCSPVAQGLGWDTLQVCRTAELCVSGEGGQVAGCIPPACEVGQFRCMDQVLQSCSDSLTNFAITDVCVSAAHCDKDTGNCKEVPCQPGETRCNDKTLERCNPEQTAWVPQTETPCDSLELCEITRQIGAPACQTAACEAGAVACDGSTITQCNAGRTAMESVQDCFTAALCTLSVQTVVPGAVVKCIAPTCDVGEHRCDGASLLVCNDDRTEFSVERTCEGPPFCNSDMADQGLPEGSPGCLDAPCEPGQSICNGAQPAICKPDQTGFDALGPPCESRELCIDGTRDAPAFCRAPTCRRGPGTNEYQCVGNQLQRCNTQLTGYDTINTCATAGLCAPRANNGCINPSCDVGQRRCNSTNGAVEVCNAQRTGFQTENNCGGNSCRPNPPTCNDCVPGSGATCTNGDIRTCNGGVASTSDCGAAGCRATQQGPLCNQCTPGSPPACTGGDIVTCNNGVPSQQDCGAAGCRATQQGPVCNQCVPGSAPTCTNGDIVVCNSGALQTTDCGAPGCRVTQQGPVCNQCVPSSAPTCSNGDIVSCNANGNPVVTDCGAPGCRTTTQGPVCNQCVVGAPACNDNNACTTDTCAAPGTCSNPPASAGTGCGGGNVCNGSGACVQCTSAAQCNDNNVCTTDNCGGGACTHGPVAAGTGCGSGNVCNATGVCVQCTNAAQCDDRNACTTDNCSGGLCTHGNVASGTCAGGVCNGSGVCVQCTTAEQCPDDINACTSRACEGNSCRFRIITGSCPLPPPISTGVCNVSGACVQCIDNAGCRPPTECTTSACSGAGTCITTSNNARCDDGIACTVDSCRVDGACSHLPDNSACPPSSDGCTIPRCDVRLGCLADPVLVPTTCVAADGSDGTCVAGACVPDVEPPPVSIDPN